MIKMVISRNDIKRRRKDSDTTLDTLPDSPKRTKVHAQRKFAQGSNVSSPVITPVKDIEKEKVKIPEIIPPPQELLPTTRPNTEDFLTFLCFRGTQILPPTLDFFNTATTINVASQSKESQKPEKSNDNPEQKSERPFIAFGVRKRADPFVSSKLEKKRRHALALQTLRRKYQEQRMAKIRAHTIEKMSQGVKIKNKPLVRTRSVTKQEVDKTKRKNVVKKVISKHVKVTATVKRPLIKPKMCLRSRGRFIHRELTAPLKPKLKRQIIKKKEVKNMVVQKNDVVTTKSSSEFSSDDDQPLVKTIKTIKKNIKSVPKTPQKIIRKLSAPIKKEPLRITRSTPTLKQIQIHKKPKLDVKKEITNIEQENIISQRPTRKTKEAASLYMNLLGPKLVTDPTITDDDSIDSFPELPNVRRTEQREIEMKANIVSKNTTRLTRKSSEIINKNVDKIKPKITKNTKIIKKDETISENSSLKSEKIENKIELRSNKVIAPLNTLNKKVEESLSDSEEISDKTSVKSEKNEIKKQIPSKKKIATQKTVIKKVEKNCSDETSENNDVKSEIKENKKEARLKKVIVPQKSITKKVKQGISNSEVKSDNITKSEKIGTKKEIQVQPKRVIAQQKSTFKKVEQKLKNSVEISSNNNKKSDNNEKIKEIRSKKVITPQKTVTTKLKQHISDSEISDKSIKSNKKENMKEQSSKKVITQQKTIAKKSKPNLSESEQLSVSSVKSVKKKIKKEPLSKKEIASQKPVVKKMKQNLSGSEEMSDSSIKSEKKENKRDVKTKKVAVLQKSISKKGDLSFSDSDEEPLVKLKTKKKIVSLKKVATEKVIEKKMAPKKDENTIKTRTSIPKKENKSFPVLSDDDEEKAFRGFVKSEETNKSQKMLQKSICLHTEPKLSTPSADLLCKDIGRRFGKGKVNMSTEQIEKWLNESALVEECKKEPFELVNEEKISIKEEKIIEKCDEKIQNPEPKITEIKNKLEILKSPIEQNIKPPTIEKNSKTDKSPPEKRCIFQQRRSILNKDRKEIPNLKAFSPNNESSVYAFEADFEMPVSTPFRSQFRRSSSTTTSKSEEDTSKQEDEDKKKPKFNKFRLPAVVKQTKTQNSKEVSVMLSPEENNSASIAVQVNLDNVTTDNNVSMECSTQTDTEDGQLFYIPLQQKQTNTNQSIIQGVAVKLGTEGNNQRVVMHAKLVTQNPDNKLPSINQKPLAQTTHMCPPIGTVQPTYRPKNQDMHRMKSNETRNDNYPSNLDPKNTIPSSPSASSSSSAKIYKRPPKPRGRFLDICQPINNSEFPSVDGPIKLVDALTFQPTEKEFQDPIEFIEKIRPMAEKFGICRIIPPANFKPDCKVSDDMRFTAYNQYVHKMLRRWGPNFKELMAIKKYLATQSITLTHPPWIGGMEIDLPRLYQTVQSLGGLKEVIEKKRWPRVAEGMKIPKSAQDRVTKLDDIYCKYLLPYDTLSPAEREKLFDEVETDWAKHESRILLRSQENQNPTSNDNESDESSDDEAEECITKGRNMALNAFYRIARNTMSMWFRTPEPSAEDVEQEFWKHVNNRQNHLCVHSGSIDSGSWGYGFACNKNSPFARHPWNLKIFTNNSGSVLRSMGPVMGVTVPTLHVGMVFSACCWYRDPHGLPWIEYLHTGASKIWYGIPDSFSNLFQTALKKLVPNYIRNKTLWLPSDTAMVPPNLLTQNGVSLCRTVQEPGQFIVVFPKAFTSCVCTGYAVSESVYFAPSNWLLTARHVFKDIRESCEPSMFSWERLLINIASDHRTNLEILKQILPDIEILVDHEKKMREKLEKLGLSLLERLPLPENNGKRKRKLQDDDGEYECEICRANLFVSMVTNSHEEGIYCLDHAVEHIEKKPAQLKYIKLLFTHNLKELDGLIEKIKTNIELKAQRKIPSKFAGMATLLK